MQEIPRVWGTVDKQNISRANNYRAQVPADHRSDSAGMLSKTLATFTIIILSEISGLLLLNENFQRHYLILVPWLFQKVIFYSLGVHPEE